MRSKILFFMACLLVFSLPESRTQDPFNEKIKKLKSEYAPPDLTKEEMYEDFDYFVDIIKNCNPLYPVIKVVTGYDMLENLASLRPKIDSSHSVYDFMRIMKTAMEYVLDGHCWIGNEIWWHRYGLYKDEVALLGLTDRDFAYMFHYRDSVFYKYPPLLDLCYSDGRYYLKYASVFYQGGDSVVMPAGSEVLSFDGQPIRQYLGKFRNYNSAWDNDRKIFYARRMYIPSGGETVLQFATGSNPVSVKFFRLKQRERVFNFQKFHKIHIHYFSLDSVLYIRLPLMSADTAQMTADILPFKNYPVKGVVVDIRENYGGNDKVWEHLLALIGGSPVHFHSSLIMNDDPEVTRRYPGYTVQRSWSMLQTGKPFIVLDDEEAVIENAKENIGYKGTIYILTDDEIFSSAGSFASLGKQNERVKTVGIPTGKYNGRGATPNGFVLPNSRMPFRLSITLDDANISEPVDFLHDSLSYPVSPTLRYFQYYHDPQRPYDVDEVLMYQQDEIFLKALQLIRE